MYFTINKDNKKQNIALNQQNYSYTPDLFASFFQ